MHFDATQSLRACAEFLGRLLLLELDAEELRRLRVSEVTTLLSEWGLELPKPQCEDPWLEERAAEYHDLFLRPQSGPLVQSLWVQGRYEGDAAVRIRQLARSAGIEFQPAAARGAAPDHLGSLLVLWAQTEESAPAVATEIKRHHLDWARLPLGSNSAQGGFYGTIAGATLALVEELSAQPD